MDVGRCMKLHPSSSSSVRYKRGVASAETPVLPLHRRSTEGVQSARQHISPHSAVQGDGSTPHDIHVPDLEAFLTNHDLADFVVSPPKQSAVCLTQPLEFGFK